MASRCEREFFFVCAAIYDDFCVNDGAHGCAVRGPYLHLFDDGTKVKLMCERTVDAAFCCASVDSGVDRFFPVVLYDCYLFYET